MEAINAKSEQEHIDIRLREARYENQPYDNGLDQKARGLYCY